MFNLFSVLVINSHTTLRNRQRTAGDIQRCLYGPHHVSLGLHQPVQMGPERLVEQQKMVIQSLASFAEGTTLGRWEAPLSVRGMVHISCFRGDRTDVVFTRGQATCLSPGQQNSVFKVRVFVSERGRLLRRAFVRGHVPILFLLGGFNMAVCFLQPSQLES